MQHIFKPVNSLGNLRLESSTTRLAGAVPYAARAAGDGLAYEFEPGFLRSFRWLSADFLLDGEELVVFVIHLQEGERGPRFSFSFGLLNQCQARMRLPLEAVNQNRWLYPREGAWLKPTVWGERVDLARVDRMEFQIHRMAETEAHFEMSALTATAEEPAKLERPLLPKGALIDALGQSRLRGWASKSLSAEEVTRRLQTQLADAPAQRWPENFSRWGGWKEMQLGASGFFRTARAEGRWWLVDPEGHPFWSAGVDCVNVDTGANASGLESALEWLPEEEGDPQREPWEERFKIVNFLRENYKRAFGEQDWHARWAEITAAELRRIGFNTVANWSDWRMAAAAGIPYTRPLGYEYAALPQIYRDFPDVFHPDFPAVCERFAAQLEETRQDPAFIGYFMMNEPTWGFAQLTPAEGMLFNTPDCFSRRALADWLRERYATDAAWAAAWGLAGADLGETARGAWTRPLNEKAHADLAEFSALLVERFFGGLSAACRAVDPNHLNLGIRYYTVPPEWALAGMRRFDVFSMNCYKQRLPAEQMEGIAALLEMPILIGEWHFGALDAGLPASGIGRVRDQAGRGQAYRIYLEDAAAKPWCVGVHYFILFDQSALGRFDGENYNIGFIDVCNRPYAELCAAARASHEAMYAVAAGRTEAFADAPEYLPLLFL